MATESSSGRTGRPARTSRTEITDAARALIERDGWERLTVRRLAAELGIGTTTLYHHIADREDLLILVLNEHFDAAPRPDLPDDPVERIMVAALGAHQLLRTLPWAAEVLTADGFLARVGESSLWMAEAILAGAVDHGCTPEQSVHIFRHIWYHLVGEILVRANSRRRPAPATDPVGHFRTVGGGRLPHLESVGGRWVELAATDTYAAGLRALVIGLLDQPPGN